MPAAPAAAEAGAAAAAAGAAPGVAVTDRGNGLYELRFTATRAGAYALRARLAAGGDGAECAVACQPGVPDPEGFAAAWAPGAWAAGAPGLLTVTRRDCHGNVTGAPGAPPLRAVLKGAGPAAAVAEEAGDGSVSIACSAHVAGAYALDVRCAASGAPIAGSPFQVGINMGICKNLLP